MPRRKSRTPGQAAAVLSGRAPRLEVTSITAAGGETPGGNTSVDGDAVAGPGRTRWSGVIGFEGQLTGDGRVIEPGALAWETPVPLRHVTQDVGAHDGAVTVGRILTITRDPESGAINATGDFDTSDYAVEAARQVADGVQCGISMDLDTVSFEVRVARDVLDMLTGDGDVDVTDDEPDDDEEEDSGGGDHVTVSEVHADDEIMATTSARVRGATLVAIPAFADAKISLTTASDDPADEPADDEPADLVASARPPVAPPRGWFDNPELTEVTPITITDEGRIYGHVAVWGTCHIGFPGQCVQPPHSEQDYRMFELGAVRTREGDDVPVGHITFDTVHAGPRMSASQAMAHYENTGRVGADVVAGEDEHGIWVSGALRPGMTPDKIRELRSSPMSGDWRRMGGNLELVAVLAVNVPGFPVPRTQGLVASGDMVTLVASGMIPPAEPPHPGRLSRSDLEALQRAAARQRSSEALTLAARTSKMRAKHLRRRVALAATSLTTTRDQKEK